MRKSKTGKTWHWYSPNHPVFEHLRAFLMLTWVLWNSVEHHTVLYNAMRAPNGESRITLLRRLFSVWALHVGSRESISSGKLRKAETLSRNKTNRVYMVRHLWMSYFWLNLGNVLTCLWGENICRMDRQVLWKTFTTSAWMTPPVDELSVHVGQTTMPWNESKPRYWSSVFSWPLVSLESKQRVTSPVSRARRRKGGKKWVRARDLEEESPPIFEKCCDSLRSTV